MAIFNINIPSQLPPLAGNALRNLRVNAAGNGTEWVESSGELYTVISANTTAALDKNYITVVTLTITDPTPVEGKGYTVYVRNGTTTVGGVGYVTGTLVYRFFHSGAWSNRVIVSGAYTLPVSDGTPGQIPVTNGSGVVSWQTISANPGGSSGMVQFNNGGSFGGSSNLFWDIANNRLGIGESNPATPLQIGSSPMSVINLNNSGGNAFISRQDINYALSIRLDNQLSTGANTTSFYGARAGDMQIAMGCTNETYTGSGSNSYFGNQPRSGVIIAKASSNNPAKLKFIATNMTNESINRFEWISGTALSGTFINGTTATPIMSLVGNGSLLLGTVTDNASALFSMESTNKGLLIPRMTDAQIAAIASPATGLLVYSITINTFVFYNGSAWRKLNDSPL